MTTLVGMHYINAQSGTSHSRLVDLKKGSYDVNCPPGTIHVSAQICIFFTFTDIACSPNFSPSLYFCAKSEVNNTFFFILHFVVFVYRSDLCCKAGVELELMFHENNEAFK